MVGKPLSQHANKKNYKYKVVFSAAKIFNLNEDETEALANKAGLSLRIDEHFNTYLRDLFERSNDRLSEFYKSVQVSERMAQYIKSGVMPSKETLLAIVISMGLPPDTIQNLLKKAGYILSDSLPNDTIILWMLDNSAFNQKVSRLQAINETLHEFELPLLMTRDKNKS